MAKINFVCKETSVGANQLPEKAAETLNSMPLLLPKVPLVIASNTSDFCN